MSFDGLSVDWLGPMLLISVWLDRATVQLWFCGSMEWHLWPTRYVDPDDGCELFWWWSVPWFQVRAWSTTGQADAEI